MSLSGVYVRLQHKQYTTNAIPLKRLYTISILHGIISQKTVSSPSQQNNLQSADTPTMPFRFGLNSVHIHIGLPTKMQIFDSSIPVRGKE